ncbi:hypothetical protein V1524DRAFT_442959 [Lipomyces starkeyi]
MRSSMIADEILLQPDLLSYLLADIPIDANSGVYDHLTQAVVPKVVDVDNRTIDSLVRSYTWRMKKYYPLVHTNIIITTPPVP